MLVADAPLNAVRWTLLTVGYQTTPPASAVTWPGPLPVGLENCVAIVVGSSRRMVLLKSSVTYSVEPSGARATPESRCPLPIDRVSTWEAPVRWYTTPLVWSTA